MKYLAKIFIRLRPTVNDPQGLTIKSGLHQLGFEEIDDVRSGKYMELRFSSKNQSEASSRVKEMCEKLLANPIVETYSFDIGLEEK